MNKHPFFIIGVHRSGTTLLRYMLSSSPRIYIPPESDFIPRFFLHAPANKLTEERVATMLAIIFEHYRFVNEWRGERPKVDAFLRAMPDRTPAAFLNTLYQMYAHQNGAVRWADKTPIYTSYVDLIHNIFPKAKFIHIIRDGRDVALSMLDKWGARKIHVDMYFAARNWVRRIRKARADGTCLGPELYYELRYEQLVENPALQLQALCNFLDEPFVPTMAKPHYLARRHIQQDGFHAPIRKPPTTKRIGRWQREMKSVDVRLFQRVAGPLMCELGYELADTGKISGMEYARLLALRTKYETLQAGRRVLQLFGLFPPI
jgi:hypothetical protein